jgi:hypothetical protein
MVMVEPHNNIVSMLVAMVMAWITALPLPVQAMAKPPSCVIIPLGAVQISGGPLPAGHAAKSRFLFKVSNAQTAWDGIVAKLEDRKKRTGVAFTADGADYSIIHRCDRKLDVVVQMTKDGDAGVITVEIVNKGG